MASNSNWSERTDSTVQPSTSTTGLGANSPSDGDSRFGRRDSMTSIESWSERTEQSSPTQTNTAGLGAISPSRICFGDEFIVENSDLFRETIVARNVYAAWARKLTTAKPDDPDLQNIHLEVGKSGEIVSNLLAKLNIPLFKIPASEKELDCIIFRLKSKKIEPSPVKNQEVKKPAAVSPPSPAPRTEKRREASIPMASLPPKQLVRKARASPRSSPPPSPTPPPAPSVEGVLLEGTGEEDMELRQQDSLQTEIVVPVVTKNPASRRFLSHLRVTGGNSLP
ncbi:hypothetical protein TNCV_4277181 [Trichonephila clavipes]|nr:hypothetical protein TNCV_4277181 [Trichonephila clavipes]